MKPKIACGARDAHVHGSILMKILFSAILAALVLAAQPAAAQWRSHGGRHAEGGRQFDVQAPRQRQGGYERSQPREFRQPERRDYRQPDRDYRQPERSDRRPDGRLTDDERRNLRRDLDRANREIYQGR